MHRNHSESLFEIIAHRGASLRAPENTMAAFQAAFDTGCRSIETDVQQTSDNILVLCHDQTLERYGHGLQTVEACSYAMLKKLDFGTWFSPDFDGEKILCLDDLFARFSDTLFYHIELKGVHPDLAQNTLKTVHRHSLQNHVLYTSFSLGQLQRMRNLSGDAKLGWLIPTITPEALETACTLSLFQLCPKAINVTNTSVQAALKFVSHVRAWGCPRECDAAIKTVQQLQQMQCSGITMDEPLWASEYLPPASGLSEI